MIVSDSSRSTRWEFGSDIREIGLVLKPSSQQMDRAAGGWKQLSRSLGAHYLVFVPSRLAGLQCPVFNLQPGSLYLILIYLLRVLLNACFSHSWIGLVPSLLKSGYVYNSNLRGFWLPPALIAPLLGGWCTAKAARRVFCPVAATDHPVGKQLITPVSWASWDVNSPSEELHLMIPVGCIYGGWTSLCPTALRAKTSSADNSQMQQGPWLQALVLQRADGITVWEEVTGVDVPLLTSTCFCYLYSCCSGHKKTLILQTAVTMEEHTAHLRFVTALHMEAAAPFICKQKVLFPSPLQAMSSGVI